LRNSFIIKYFIFFTLLPGTYSIMILADMCADILLVDAAKSDKAWNSFKRSFIGNLVFWNRIKNIVWPRHCYL